MEKRITVTLHDYERLMRLMNPSPVGGKLPPVAGALFEKLSLASRIKPEAVKAGVVTMNSRVYLREANTGRESEVTITYPSQADPRNRRISVFSTIGMELLGRSENDTVSWEVPTGVGVFHIVKVTYQPEAEGNFSL